MENQVKAMKLVAVLLMVGWAAYAADTASVSGKVTFDGTAPKPKKLKTDSDPQCQAMHADSPLLSEEVLVGAGGGLQNAFVYIKSGVKGEYPCPKEPVKIDQHGCHYEPHILGMHTGQLLLIKNSDDTTHNIHAMPEKNAEFNNAQPAGSADLKKTFKEPEVMVKVKCDLHSWMSAYVGVLEHPFFSVSGADGAFSIKNLPAGDYEIVAWHEKYGEQSAKVKVGNGEAKTQDFKFSKAAE